MATVSRFLAFVLAVSTILSSLDGDTARMTQVCGLGLPALVFGLLGLANGQGPWSPPSGHPKADEPAAASGSRTGE